MEKEMMRVACANVIMRTSAKHYIQCVCLPDERIAILFIYKVTGKISIKENCMQYYYKYWEIE